MSKQQAMSETQPYRPPPTVSRAALLIDGSDAVFRNTLFLMVLALGRLQTCREAFGRAMGLTGPQFAVLVGAAYRQGQAGVSIGELAGHVRLAATHVTTEVGRLIRLGLMVKRANADDRRSRLVSLSPAGEAAIAAVAPFVREVNDLLFEDVGDEEWRALDRFLRRFADNGLRALAAIQDKDGTEACRPLHARPRPP